MRWGADPTHVSVADFNEDGNLDQAVTNSGDNTVSILLGNGDGTFNTAVTYGTGAYPDGIEVGDFNKDGHLDLAIPNTTDSTVSVLLGAGDGTFGTKTDFAVASAPFSVATGDFDKDGRPDVTVASLGADSASVLINTSSQGCGPADEAVGPFEPARPFRSGPGVLLRPRRFEKGLRPSWAREQRASAGTRPGADERAPRGGQDRAHPPAASP